MNRLFVTFSGFGVSYFILKLIGEPMSTEQLYFLCAGALSYWITCFGDWS